MSKTICEDLLELLGGVCVRDIFGVTGDALNPFVDAIRRDGRFRWITVRHEEAGAFAAAAQAKMTGKLAVCCGTVGPGALHLLNGLYDAKRDRAPVLAITGQVPENEYGTSYFQEVDLETVFSDACVFNQTVRSPDQFQRLAQQAVQTAIDKRGVAHLSIPVDIIGQKVPNDDIKREIFVDHSARVPSADAVNEAARALSAATRVTVLIGDGARGAEDEVLATAEKLKAPIVNTLKGSDVLAFDNPYRVGGIGHLGTPQGLEALDNCDALLVVGADFPYRAFLPKGIDIVQIDINASHIGRRCAVTHPLVGDSKVTLAALAESLETKTQGTFLSKIQRKSDAWTKKLDRWSDPKRSKDIIHPQSLIRQAGEMANDNALFVADVGTVTVWAARHLRIRQGQRLFGSFNHGSLGVGLPGAMGLQTIDRERQVVALCGDGAFGMLMTDFITAVKYDLPLTAIVLNNEKFGFVELEMQATGYPRYATDLTNPDFAKFAENCGGIGIRIDSPDQVADALRTGLSSRKPVVIDAVVNPDELVLPPKIDAKHAVGYAVGKMKELWLEHIPV